MSFGYHWTLVWLSWSQNMMNGDYYVESEDGLQGYRTMFIYLSWVCYIYSTWISQTKCKTGKKYRFTNILQELLKFSQLHMCDYLSSELI
jgi:hypothetical protein